MKLQPAALEPNPVDAGKLRVWAPRERVEEVTEDLRSAHREAGAHRRDVLQQTTHQPEDVTSIEMQQPTSARITVVTSAQTTSPAKDAIVHAVRSPSPTHLKPPATSIDEASPETVTPPANVELSEALAQMRAELEIRKAQASQEKSARLAAEEIARRALAKSQSAPAPKPVPTQQFIVQRPKPQPAQPETRVAIPVAKRAPNNSPRQPAAVVRAPAPNSSGPRTDQSIVNADARSASAPVADTIQRVAGSQDERRAVIIPRTSQRPAVPAPSTPPAPTPATLAATPEPTVKSTVEPTRPMPVKPATPLSSVTQAPAPKLAPLTPTPDSSNALLPPTNLDGATNVPSGLIGGSFGQSPLMPIEQIPRDEEGRRKLAKEMLERGRQLAEAGSIAEAEQILFQIRELACDYRPLQYSPDLLARDIRKARLKAQNPTLSDGARKLRFF
jgi:hypothetical protein